MCKGKNCTTCSFGKQTWVENNFKSLVVIKQAYFSMKGNELTTYHGVWIHYFVKGHWMSCPKSYKLALDNSSTCPSH